MKHVKTNTKTKRIRERESKQRAIDKNIIENEWQTRHNIHFKRADTPSDFQTYKGRS